MSGLYNRSSKEEEKSLHESTEELQKNAQTEKRSLEARSERGWNMSTPNSSGDEHGEIHGNRESSAQRRFWQVKTELRRQTGRQARHTVVVRSPVDLP